MTVCPPAEKLSALLSGTLPQADVASLDTHVSSCELCQNRLNDLTDSPRLADWLGPQAKIPRPFPFLMPSDRPGDLGTLGRFRIEAELGRGGMGHVFRGWDEELRRPVAVKVLRIGQDDDAALSRFTRESQAAAKLVHDHIVPVYSFEQTEDGRQIIVMPVISGMSLRERLRNGNLFPREAATIVRQVADALSAAHAAGLIHRDVKPGNVLLDAADGRAKLTDFGLARSTTHGETITQSGMILGTPEYLSPEQVTHPSQTDPRSDLYSLGAMLYECLTGVVPFRGNTLDVIRRHATDEPIAPRRLNAAVPVNLETICMKCLEKKPANRYASAQAVRDELDRWLDGRAILARPAGTVERAARWIRRNPFPVAIVAVSVLGFAASSTGWWRAGVKAEEAAANALTAKMREDEAIAARSLADEKAKLADERSTLALSAVNTLISKAQNLASDAPGTLKLKQQLNEAALADLRQLTEAISRVPGADRSTIAAHQKLGDTFNLLGQTKEAFREWDFARQHSEQMLTDTPEDVQLRIHLAQAHYAIGYSQIRLLDYKTAMIHMDAAVKALSDYEPRFPDDSRLLDMLATAIAGRADVDWYTGNGEKAVAGYKRSIAFRTRTLIQEPANAEVRSKILHAYSRIGYVCLSVLHDYPTAEKHFRDQLAIAKDQLTRTRDDRTWQRNYHIILLDLSSALHRLGDGPAAEQAAREALGWLERTATADPDNALTQRDHAMGRDHLALALSIQGKHAEAEREFVRAFEIFEKVASRSATVAIVASDLPIIAYKLAVCAEIQGKYTEAAKWYGLMAEYYRKLAGPTANTFQAQLIIANITIKRIAAELTPQALADKDFAFSQPKEVAPFVAANRILMLARSGKVPTAREEQAELRNRFPESPVNSLLPPFLEAAAARDAKDPTEKLQYLDSGATALITAVKNDRSMLDTLYIISDLTQLRTRPAFLNAIRPRRHKPD